MRARAAAAAGLALATAALVSAADITEYVKLNAHQQYWVREQMWCGLGEVEIAYQDITLRCDQIEVDLATMKLHAEGNVVIDQGEARFACARADFDLRNKVGTFYEAQGFFPPSYHFRGAEIERLDETHYRLHRGSFTSCNLDDTGPPPWAIEMRDAVIEVEGYGHFRGASLEVRGVPVFYAPRLLWPVKRERSAGLLVPGIGYSSRNGAYLGNALFVPVSRSVDTTLYLDLYSKGYLGLANEWRWAPAENAKGELLATTVYNPDTNRWEWKVQGKHTQLFPGGYALRAELLDYSDIDFFQRFERTFDRNALRSIYSYGTMSRTWGPQAINLRADYRKTFGLTSGSSGATGEAIFSRTPELEYRLRSTRVLESPFYVSLNATADRFWVNRSASLRGGYGRVDAFPTVSMLISGVPWFNVTPSLGARATYYTARYSADRTSLESDPLWRQYGTAGISLVGPSFSRIWTNGDAKLKHLIEPRVEYSYVSNPGDSSLIPIFDEKDSVVVQNRLRATLANRLFYKSGSGSSREVASLEISQDYSFSDPLTFARPSEDLPASRSGPFTLWLRTAPFPQTTLDVRTSFDAVTHGLRSASLTGGVYAGSTNVGLTWYASFNDATRQALSSQTSTFFAIAPPTARWRVESQLVYDIHNAKLLDQRYVFRWRGSCWAAYAEIRDYRIEPYKRRDYRIAIDLTGLGTFLDVRGSLDALAR